MATLYVTEFQSLGQLGSLPVQAPHWPKVNTSPNNVAIGASANASNAFSSTTRLIRVAPDTTCSVEIGTTVTATTASTRMVANSVEYFSVRPGDVISVILNS